MDRHPAPVALRVQWQSPGDEAHVDHLVAVLLRHQRRLASPEVRPWILWSSLIVGGGFFVVATWPGGLLMPLFFGVFYVALKVLGPRQMAKGFRGQPAVRDPYTVTLDTDGFHVVSPNVADHLRWAVFESATIDEDVLLLRTRGTRFLRGVPLAPLDPAVDRAALVAELNRLIDAEAPPA